MAEGIEGMSELLDRVRAMEQNLGTGIDQPLLRAGVAALKAAQDRIDAGGPGWPPNKTHTPLLHRTGRLLSSLTVGGPANVVAIDGATIEVGTNVSYARYLQGGTGARSRYVQRLQQIAGALGAAGMAPHPTRGGMPPRPFLFFDERLAEVINQIFASAVMQGGPGG